MHFAKNLAPQHLLCLLLLGTALGACSPSRTGSNEEALHGIRTVSFDKNGGDTEAVPASMTLHPPATTLGTLPEQPTRAGHRFGGWNTERDGSGSPFAASTPVPASILTIVYAQWEPRLSFHLLRDTLTFTPMKDGAYEERALLFTVRVLGLKNAADADNVQLDVRTENERLWFSWQVSNSSFVEGTQTFTLHFFYQRSTFTEEPATLHFNLKNIPPGYEYAGETRTLRVATADGKDKARPIPVHKGNIVHFNRYANTTEGLGLHYQLIENVTLPQVAKGESNWTAIGNFDEPFVGSFDGKGHSIFGLSIDKPEDTHQGMFGYIVGAHIQNLRLEGGSILGESFLGCVVGVSESGTLENSHASCSVSGTSVGVGGLLGTNSVGTVEDSHATGNVSGKDGVGGLVGRNSGTVHNSSAAGDVKGDDNVGGLLGYNSRGTVENSRATGNVVGTNSSVGGVVGYNNGGTLAQSYFSTGSVSGNENVGGLVGLNGSGGLRLSSARVQNGFSSGNVHGNNNVGGVVGANISNNSLFITVRSWVQDCFSSGNVDGTNNVGGVVGFNSQDSQLRNSFATGHVDGDTSVGGVVGGSGGTVQSCAALNPSVTGNTDLGRVAGLDNYMLANNHARSDMRLTPPPTAATIGADLKDGADMSAAEYGSQSFWEAAPMHWDFVSTWEWGPTGLPVLQGVGGEQRPWVRTVP